MLAKKIILLIPLCAIFCTALAIGGPPVPPGLEEDTASIKIPTVPSKKIEQIEKNLKSKEKLIWEKSLAIIKTDSLLNRPLEGLDTSKLQSFKEIIIENETILVNTDSGMTVITKSKLDSILPPEASGASEGASWGKNVVVEEDKRVDTDIQVFSGNVTVKGMVNGDVLTVGGDIYISSTGYIKGNAIAIGGKVKKEDGAKVNGSVVQMRVPLLAMAKGSFYQIIHRIILISIAFGLILSGLSVALFPKPICRISKTLRENPIKSFLIGYGSYFGIFIIWILLLVSIIGIPLAILGQPVAMLLLGVFAYTATNLAVGEKFFREKTALRSFLYGGLITTIVPLILLIIGYITGSLFLFIINMILLGLFAIMFLPFGIGAAVLSKFGRSSKIKPQETPAESV